MHPQEYDKMVEEIKKLPPTMRAQKIKELEEQKKKLTEKDLKAVIDESIKEIEKNKKQERNRLEAKLKRDEEKYIRKHDESVHQESLENVKQSSSAGYQSSSYLASQQERSISEMYGRLQSLGSQVSRPEDLESAANVYNQIMQYSAREDEKSNTAEASKIKIGAKKLMEQMGLHFANNDYDP